MKENALMISILIIIKKHIFKLFFYDGGPFIQKPVHWSFNGLKPVQWTGSYMRGTSFKIELIEGGYSNLKKKKQAVFKSGVNNK